MTMLEQADNDLPKANEENVSEQTSTSPTQSADEDVKASENETSITIDEQIAEETSTAHMREEKISTEEDEHHDLDEEESDEDDTDKEEDEKAEAAKRDQFEAMQLKELVAFFANTLKTDQVQHLKSTVDILVKVFNQKLAAASKKEKQAFIDEGGNPDAFYFNPNEKKEFGDLLRRYKSDRSTYYRSLEEKQKKNLAIRHELIEELKGLINVEQDINQTYNQFKDLQKRWKECGQVPRMDANDIWRTYHHHVGIFYDFLHLNRELRDLDFKFNLEQKLSICEQAEALVNMEDVSKAFRHLQVLHKKWKDELGPVDKEHSDQVWDRFSNATKIIHDKRRYFIQNQEEIFEANLIKKQAIITQMRELVNEEFTNKTNIHSFSNTFNGLRDAFFAVGKAPLKKRDDLWSEFKHTSNLFSKKRHQFYKALKKVYRQNAAIRKDLISQIEQLGKQGNFRETTSKVIDLQKEWRNIGPVSRKDHTDLDRHFRAACHAFFNAKDANRNKANQEQKMNLEQKEELIRELKTLLQQDNPNNADVDDLVSKWNGIGFVPRNRIKIIQEFDALVEKAYRACGLSKSEITQKSYQNKLDTIEGDENSVLKEIQSLSRRIDEIKQEMIQLETNLQFFNTSQENNPIVVKVKNDIEKQREQLAQLKEKKRLVKSLLKN